MGQFKLIKEGNFMKFLRNLILSFVFAGAMSLTTSANAACKVHLGDFDWDSANVHTAIASIYS